MKAATFFELNFKYTLYILDAELRNEFDGKSAKWGTKNLQVAQI
jgi:hypothetical protein